VKIHNVRLGLATNSSSVHSLILMRKGEPLPNTNQTKEFGWDYFTAASREAKENYLAIILRDNLYPLIGEETSDIFIEALFSNKEEGPIRGEDIRSVLRDGYVDHQSSWHLPRNWSGKGIDLQFFLALRDYIVNNPVAILGGNDNGGEGHPLLDEGEPIDVPLNEDESDLIARNDGTHWVLFNRDNGAKVRLTFSGNMEAENVTKAAVPELVDIKISNYCPYGCKFCYQNSSVDGQHADKELLENLLVTLSKLKVFEVALGGGEPTLHPHFFRLLEHARSYGIIPNFTTKNLGWFSEKGKLEIVKKNVGAFAYSAESVRDVQRLAAKVKKTNFPADKVSVQYVLNVGGNLRGILDECRRNYFRLTLLGFKTTGLGREFPQIPENWIEVVKKFQQRDWLQLGVDTSVVKTYGKQIQEELKVNPTLYTAEEGKFSMYIDAVERKIGPSSFCPDWQYQPLPVQEWRHGENYPNQEKLVEAFKGF